VTQSCGKCKHWPKPKGTKAVSDTAFVCTYPFFVPEEIKVPTSIEVNVMRQYTCRDDGENCPTWEKRK